MRIICTRNKRHQKIFKSSELHHHVYDKRPIHCAKAIFRLVQRVRPKELLFVYKKSKTEWDIMDDTHLGHSIKFWISSGRSTIIRDGFNDEDLCTKFEEMIVGSFGIEFLKCKPKEINRQILCQLAKRFPTRGFGLIIRWT